MEKHRDNTESPTCLSGCLHGSIRDRASGSRDRLADVRQRRTVVIEDAIVLELYAEAAPEGGQIDLKRRVLHLCVKILEHGTADGAIARLQHAFNGPVMV